MKLVIETPLTAFTNDIGDVVRLFYGEGAALSSGEADGRLLHAHEETNGFWRERMTLIVGDVRREARREAPVVSGGLAEKRALKRLVKQTAYDLLKVSTGRHPAWGSLTGIRPTRLYARAMAEHGDREAAERLLAEAYDLAPEKLLLLREVAETQAPYLFKDKKRCCLYVGIPFCTTRCSYCSFSSGTLGDGKRVEPYLSALLWELEDAAEMAKETGLAIDCAYIGGGTPTSLTAAQLDRLLTAMERLFPSLAEWTVEAGRPDTLNEDKLRVMRSHPVTRISINPQTMNDETLAVIGRAHTAEDTARAYDMARKWGFDDINMDVIAALPGEDLAMFRHTLAWAERLRPESLTVHTLAIKRSSALHERGYRQDGAQTGQMLREARETAHRMGMRAYYLYRQKYMADNLENVGYCLPGKVCRYNIDNMEEQTSVLALGAGAISKVVLGQEKRILRAPNVSNIDQYILRVQEMAARRRQAFAALAETEEGERDDGHQR